MAYGFGSLFNANLSKKSVSDFNFARTHALLYISTHIWVLVDYIMIARHGTAGVWISLLYTLLYAR